MNRLPHTAIVGGMFGLEPVLQPGALPHDPLRALWGPHIRLASARSAFRLLESLLAPASVWLPSYLCGVLVQAFQSAGIRFYPVDAQLRPGSDRWLEEILPNDLVVFIDYFGFGGWSKWGEEVRRRAAWVIDDACQAMLNARWCEAAQYRVFSPRKFVGVPDGGVLAAPQGSPLPNVALPAPPAEWWLQSLAASEKRAAFDRQGGERDWFPLFQRAEAAAPLEPACMSELSSHLLTHAIDFKEIARRRRENYLLFASELHQVALFAELADEVVPLGFPIRIARRDRVREELFRRQIFPALHWPLQGIVPEKFRESHELSREMMTLPCDQRMGPQEVERVIQSLRAAMAE